MNGFRSCFFVFTTLCLVFGEADVCPSLIAQEPITLDQIMADPDWLGRAPQDAYWADDSQSIYYRRKRAGNPNDDWFEVDPQGNLKRVVADADLGAMDSDRGEFDKSHQWKVFERSGDLFLKQMKSGKVRQLTRTAQRESSPRFMADGRRVLFRRGDQVVARHIGNGLEEELVDVRAEDDPEEARQSSRKGFLPEQQQRLFETLREDRSRAEAVRASDQHRQAVDPTRPVKPFYLGNAHRIGAVEVSPNGRWCLVTLVSKQAKTGQSDKMPEFVTEDGYVRSREVRPLVGTGAFDVEKLVLLDLVSHQRYDLSYDDLPDYDSDPLVDVREENEAWKVSREKVSGVDESSTEESATIEQVQQEQDKENKQSEENLSHSAGPVKDASPKETNSDAKENAKAKSPRAIRIAAISWNDLGNQVCVELRSSDNKDRWIATVDLREKQLTSLFHRRDPAWINWNVEEPRWLADHQTFYYSTEESGYAHVYIANVTSGATRQLTSGSYVTRDITPSRDGKHIYYKANASHPGIYEIYRVSVEDGTIEQLTNLGGENDYRLSPDETKLLLTHGTAMSPPELWVQSIGDHASAKQLTRTVSAEFESLPWVAPQFVTVPSRAGRPIHARLYLPPNHDPSKGSPAVIFIHGAGYLQNAHQGWSGYFREFMFHSLLAHRGYVVLDMDYRGSAGYGRDWRTAIYRQMGHPEIDDLEDGRAWLGQTQGVDPQRVGIYGGSYGGFMTLMALFTRQDTFACGAALRPVTDWAHYNHGYTSNILNTPEVDPMAYWRSSPIEHAEGLSDPLLICHGMVDDNVFFKDTARLAQRLIELRKKDWEVAVYPVEAHGFTRPSSWYDEYRRILELFERHLKP